MSSKFSYLMMAASVLFATSCESDQELVSVQQAATSQVSFNLSTPQMASRAYSDGLTATHLQYAVYDNNGTLLSDLTNNQATINGSTTVDLQLVTGNTYSVVFWAAAPNAPYSVDFENKSVAISYDNAKSNDEARDAFYAYKTFTVEGAQSERIELKRPFAQINIGTSDYAAAESAGYVPTQSSVEVTGVANKLNFVDGTVEGDVTATFALADINKNEAFPVAGNKYLAMNYVLVPADKQLVDVAFTYTDNNLPEKEREVSAVPVQRNYRTNIYGKLLTSVVDINVEIKPAYEDGIADERIFAFTAYELQEALDAAPAGTTLINLGADINGEVYDFQKADRNVIIEGNGFKFDGSIKIHSGSNLNNGAITIKNVKFETATPAVNFIMPNDFGTENGVARRYSNNVTVENCTFTATGDAAAAKSVVGVQAKSSKNLQVLNCEATGVHSLLQAQSCDEDVIVKNSTVNGKNGVAFKGVKNAVVEGTTIVAEGYGIRFDGNVPNYGITVKNNNITAAQPFIVRKMTAQNNTIALEGNNVFTTDNVLQIVITNGSDDAAYATPTGTYSLTGAEGYVVYPSATTVATAEELQAALANNLVNDIYLFAGEFGTIVAKSNKTIIGSANAKVDCVNLNGATNLTLKNIAFNAATAKLGCDGSGTAKQPANIITGDNVNKPNKGAHNLVIDGCTFEGSFGNDGGVAIAFTDQRRGEGGSGNVTIKNCAFRTQGGYADIYGHYCGDGNNGHGDFVITGNIFESTYALSTGCYPVYLGRYASSTPVVVSENNFNKVSTIDEAIVMQDHSNYGVSYTASNNNFAQ